MNFKSSFLYASRLLFSKNKFHDNSTGKRSLIGAVLCIGISLIPLVAVLAISDSMIEGMTQRIIGLSSGDLELRFSARSNVIKDYEDFCEAAERVSSVDGVVSAYPEIQGTALAAGKTSRTGATIRAVPENLFSTNKNFSSLFEVQEGSTEFSGSNGAIIGKRISEILGLSVGDTIRIISFTYGNNNRIMPKYTSLKVDGIVSCGYQELDALWVFIPIQKGYEFLSPNSAKFNVAVVTEDPFSNELMLIKKRIENEVTGRTGNSRLDLCTVYTWKELNSSQYENFSSTKILLLLIMILIVLVASVNISSALVMLVMERKKEIAILKSMGASSTGITLSFLSVGFATGAGGIVLGLPLGLLAAININSILSFLEKIVNLFAILFYRIINGGVSDFTQIHLLNEAYYLQKVSISIPFTELLAIVMLTLVLSVVASAIPAVRAGREKPLDTLRKM